MAVPAALAILSASPGAAMAAAALGAPATEGSVRHPPLVSIVAPSAASAYRLGDPVQLRGEASDPDGPLTGDQLHWTVVRHTGAVAETVAEARGAEASFTPSDRYGAGTTYVVRFAATGPDGVGQSTELTLHPETVRVTLRSTPEGAGLAFGATSAPGTRTIEQAVGLRTELSAPETFTPVGGAEVVFDGWSDGGGRVHTIVVPAQDTEFVARYREPAQEIADAVGPRTPSDAAGVGDSARAARAVPALTFDPPNPFGPRMVGGVLRDAPAGGRVEVAVRRGTPGRRCGWWLTRVKRFTKGRPAACAKPRWIAATMLPARAGTLRWRAALGRRLPAGSYAFVVRVLDAQGTPVRFLRG